MAHNYYIYLKDSRQLYCKLSTSNKLGIKSGIQNPLDIHEGGEIFNVMQDELTTLLVRNYTAPCLKYYSSFTSGTKLTLLHADWGTKS